jgi:hypothetical protein
MLVLTAPTEIGLGLLTRLVSEENLRWNLANDAVIIDPSLNTTAYHFRTEEKPDSERPSLMDNISQNTGSIIFAMIGIGVMVILLLAVIMVLTRIRNRNSQ